MMERGAKMSVEGHSSNGPPATKYCGGPSYSQFAICSAAASISASRQPGARTAIDS